MTLTILVIDDDAHVRRSLGFVIGTLGHRVVDAASAAAGLARFTQHRPQLVFVDMVMPDGLGADLVAAMRRVDASAHIVAMSGSAEGGQHNLLARARANGADEALAKPFDFEDVERLVAAASHR